MKRNLPICFLLAQVLLINCAVALAQDTDQVETFLTIPHAFHFYCVPVNMSGLSIASGSTGMMPVPVQMNVTSNLSEMRIEYSSLSSNGNLINIRSPEKPELLTWYLVLPETEERPTIDDSRWKSGSEFNGTSQVIRRTGIRKFLLYSKVEAFNIPPGIYQNVITIEAGYENERGTSRISLECEVRE